MSTSPADLKGHTDSRAELVELFDSTFNNVYRFCLARSASLAVAEDIAAETFAEAARAFAAGRGSDVSTGWLITVARRRLIDHWRRESRQDRRLQRLFGTFEEAPPSGAAEDHLDVLEALRRLPERQRAALTLRYLDDLSVRDVALALECSYDAAESLLARARRDFAAAYGGPT